MIVTTRMMEGLREHPRDDARNTFSPKAWLQTLDGTLHPFESVSFICKLQVQQKVVAKILYKP